VLVSLRKGVVAGLAKSKRRKKMSTWRLSSNLRSVDVDARGKALMRLREGSVRVMLVKRNILISINSRC